jgi:hypothetical protein
LDVTSINNGDFIKVKGVDFGSGASSFDARVASATSGGNIQLRLDSQTGTLIGTVAVTGTGGAQTWATKSCQITGASGTHDLFLVFTGGSGDLFNFNWWKFTGAPTNIASRKQLVGSDWLKVETRSNRLEIRSEIPMDRVELMSSRAEVRELGGGSLLEWNVEGIQPGVYFLKVRSGSATKIQRVLLNM